jgi:hypothetical protein
MKTKLLRAGRRLWCIGHADRATQRANMRKWVRSLRLLGDRWVMAARKPRLTAPVPDGKISSLVLPFPLLTPRSLQEAYWKNTYTLATARALKWTEMTSLDATSWDEAFKSKEK